MSGNLACRAKNCIHNKRSTCGASNIHIRGANATSGDFTECSSFMEKGIKNSLENVYNYNIGGNTYNNYNYGVNPQINCDATKCQYNINGDCVSNYVQIDGIGALDSNRTGCQSFRYY